MLHFLISNYPLVLAFAVFSISIGCDRQRVEFRDGGSSTGDMGTGDACAPIDDDAPPSLGSCACDPLAPLCGPGLDCVAVGDTHACLAKCHGANEQGGGYITTCHDGPNEVACVSPNGPSGPSYCPACLTCSPVDPLALVCS